MAVNKGEKEGAAVGQTIAHAVRQQWVGEGSDCEADMRQIFNYQYLSMKTTTAFAESKDYFQVKILPERQTIMVLIS